VRYMNKKLIVGWDAASQIKKNGFCFADYIDNDLTNIRFEKFKEDIDFFDYIKTKYNEYDQILFCIDTPLGYPEMFSYVQRPIRPGFYDSVPDTDVKEYLYRKTELFLQQKLQMQPISICAEKIAISSLKTFNRINKIKKELDIDINVVWDFDFKDKLGMIEVYPVSLYKKLKIEHKNKKDRFPIMLTKLFDCYSTLLDKLKNSPENDDQLDALACVVIGEMFFKGECIEPENLKSVKNEGWIWVPKNNEKIISNKIKKNNCRIYFSHSIKYLKKIVEKNRENKDLLKEVKYELSFRKSKAAKELLNTIYDLLISK